MSKKLVLETLCSSFRVNHRPPCRTSSSPSRGIQYEHILQSAHVVHYRAIKLVYALLSDRDIRAATNAEGSGHLGINPFDPKMIQPSSIDVRLDKSFRVFNNSQYTHIDPKLSQGGLTSLYEVPEGQPLILHPDEFVLVSTLEYFAIPPHLAGRLGGKSSLRRLGLATHSTAGFIDPRSSGHITLELSDMASLPIALWPNIKVGQLALFKMSSPAEAPCGSGKLGSKYQGQHGLAPSRTYLNFRDEE